MTRYSGKRVVLVAGFVFGFQACKSESTTAPDIPAELIANAASPTNVVGVVGAIAPFSPAIQVVDLRTGQPMAKVRVYFTNGWVTVRDTVTDANGMASAGTWRFSTRVGTDQVSAWISGRLAIQFTATLTHDVPASIRVSDVGEGVALAGTRLNGFFVQLIDQFGNGVSHARLTFSASKGTLAVKDVTSDINGGASTGPWLLDEQPGTSELTVSADGVKPLVLPGHGLDSAALQWFELKQIRRGNTAYSPFELGISTSRFGMTPFNGCLCGGPQRGFYIETNSFRLNPGIISQKGGRFELVGTAVYLLSESELKSYFENGKLLVERFYSLSDFLFFGIGIETWVFAPSPEGK